MSHTCEDCEEEFTTLSAKRLHNCEAEEEPEPEPEPSTEENHSEDDPTWADEMALEPGYDCPECDFYKTGATISPQTFLNHLRDKHGYTSTEAHQVLNG